MTDNFFLLNEGDLKEQDKILKYFYLIDSDSIVKELKSKFSIKREYAESNSITEAFFHSVFENIFTSSSLYNDYLNPDHFLASAFFGEPGRKLSGNVQSDPIFLPHSNNLRCFVAFLKLSLRNYCITQGFFYSLYQSRFPKDGAKKETTRPLSAKNDLFLKSGYFENPEGENNGTDEAQSAQFYNSKFKSYKNLGDSNFLERILKDCHCNIDSSTFDKSKEKLSTVIEVPLVYKHWIYFIFHNDNIKNISRNLTKESQNVLQKHYKNLFTDLQNSETAFEQKCDKFIFHTLSEYYFGFSTINYADILLKQVQNPSEEYEYLKWYRGEILDNILAQLSYCPMPYTRHLFLSYAFAALRYNEDVKCDYLSSHESEALRFITVGTASPIEISSIKGLALIPEYFNTLNNITLPILSSLWNIVLDKLTPNNDSLLDYYKSYIESHYELLTSNFSSFLECEIKEMKDCCFKNEPMNRINTNINSSSFLETLTEKLTNNKNTQSNVAEEFPFSLKPHKDLPKIIYSFFYSEPDSASALHVLSNLYHELGDEPFGKERNQFRKNRALDIFNLFRKHAQ